MGFVKFQGEVDPVSGNELMWGRAESDRAPYRGPNIPLMKEDEAERFLEKAFDAGYGTFDTTNPEMLQANHTLQQVLDRTANGWYKISSWQEKWVVREGVPTMFVFVVWFIPFMMPTSAATQKTANFRMTP